MIGTWNLLVLLQTEPAQPAGRGLMLAFIYLVFFGLIAWFILLRPQRKLQERHQKMVSALQKGDEIMTEGGIIGQIVHLADDRVTIKSSDNTRLVVARAKIARVLGGEAAAPKS